MRFVMGVKDWAGGAESGLRAATRGPAWRVALVTSLVSAAVLGVGWVGCTRLPPASLGQVLESGEADPLMIVGTEMIYRFPNGRLYRARYTEKTASFVLLEPRLATQPSATFPYLHEQIRKGLHLVVWDDPAFHTTLLIDLVEGRLHASSLPMGGKSFLGSAEIVQARRVP